MSPPQDTDMAGCVAYLQLFLGWLLINFATFSMVMVPHAAHFLHIAPTMSDDDRYVVFGLWVLVEITIFFILLVSATVLMCTCSKVPPGAGFVHMMVDPGMLVLACVPFIVIRGLPRASAVHICLYSATPPAVQAANPPYALQMAASNKSYIETSPGVLVRNCLLPLFTPLEANDTLPEVETMVSKKPFEQYLMDWTSLLQCATVLPSMMRLVRYRWKMSWQPFLHSHIYFFLQTLDSALLVATSIQISTHPWNLATQIIIYINVIVTTTCSLAVAIPPIYIGNHITNRYIKLMCFVGTSICDIPYCIIRLVLSQSEAEDIHQILDGIFYVMLVKELICITAVMSLLCKKISLCVGNTYLSLNVHDSECEDYDMNEMEEYV